MLKRKPVSAEVGDGNQKRKQREETTGPPPEDFRELDIFPTKQDILEIQKPYLRKNIVQGAYEVRYLLAGAGGSPFLTHVFGHGPFV